MFFNDDNTICLENLFKIFIPFWIEYLFEWYVLINKLVLQQFS